jgi:hypothetical protein
MIAYVFAYFLGGWAAAAHATYIVAATPVPPEDSGAKVAAVLYSVVASALSWLYVAAAAVVAIVEWFRCR